MDSLIHNVRLGVRSLLRMPGFALTACLTLAVGIGLSTAVFTVADALLLRQLPVLDQDRIVVLSGQTRDRQIENWPLSFENARQFAGRTRAMSQLAFFGYEGAAAQTLRDNDRTTTLQRALVSGDFFDVLGVQIETLLAV